MHPADRAARLADAYLYLCTPLRDDLPEFLDAVLAGGVDIVQLRDKNAERAEQVAACPLFREACDRHEALFVVNDDPDVALEGAADGVHVGQDDLPPRAVRDLVGEAVLIGRSTHSQDEVDQALTEPCDYFAVGPVSATPTKRGRPGIGLEPLRHAATVADRPWFVTGGMAPDTAHAVLQTGATRLVVVRALTEAPDPQTVAATLTGMLR
ncbi:thiamine phosphate synthase [Euzebya tangerina]|uniref:thiamine phosphate synthase n=1 Tax=Euzebya tangerina TaxID=591198 RepID=UPI000E30DC7B|nr:thiamine phosphate synthase [Euzebya tangerina]